MFRIRKGLSALLARPLLLHEQNCATYLFVSFVSKIGGRNHENPADAHWAATECSLFQ